MSNQDRIHTTKSAGKYLGGEEDPIPPKTMERWRQEGIGPPWYKIGKAVRYGENNLDEYREGCARRATCEGGTG